MDDDRREERILGCGVAIGAIGAAILSALFNYLLN